MISYFIAGFSEELEKVALTLTPAMQHALVTGVGSGALAGTIGNIVNPSATPAGKRKSTPGQAIKGGLMGGTTYLGGQLLFDALKKRGI